MKYSLSSSPWVVSGKGAPIGTLCCYIYIALGNMICIIKYSKVKPKVFGVLFKPLIAALLCGVAAFFTNLLLAGNIPSKLSTVVAIMVAAVVYVLMLIVLRAITEEDVLAFPKGEKLAYLLKKAKILR